MKSYLENPPIVQVSTTFTTQLCPPAARVASEYRAYKKRLITISCLWNRGSLKVLDDTKLIHK
jgi:hypothetical protein